MPGLLQPLPVPRSMKPAKRPIPRHAASAFRRRARRFPKEEFMKLIFAGLIGATMLGTAAANAQDTAKPAMSMPETNASMVPGLGEIMTLQQLRHIKLWFAGRAGNWPLADYEIDELNEGFEDVGKLLGGDTVDKMVGAQIKALQKAVDDKNRTAFLAA